MTDGVPDRLAVARWEADRHATVLDAALAQWRSRPLPAVDELDTDAGLRQLTDQILFRFIKLQDCMGERLVPATLEHLAEPWTDKPMRDRLDRLEKLGYLDVEAWLRWRVLRNRLAHEYPEAPAVRLAHLLQAMAQAAELLAAYRHWAARLG